MRDEVKAKQLFDLCDELVAPYLTKPEPAPAKGKAASGLTLPSLDDLKAALPTAA